MNNKKRNAALAFVGLLALSIYILACTSFSPDDTKVLYPSFDTASGAIGVAVYDREARASEMLFVPVAYDTSETNTVVAPIVSRAQWLANGRDIVIAYAIPKNGDKDSLTVAVVPWAARKPIRTFRVPEIKDLAESFMVPLCIAGDRLFFRASGKGLVRLDLRSGQLASHEFEDAKADLSLYPAPDGAGVFYVESDNSSDGKTVFGRLNPNDFSRAPLMVITNRPSDSTVVAYDPEGKVLVLVTGSETKAAVDVWRGGKVAFSREVDTHGKKRVFGNAILAANGKAVRATFQQAISTNAMAYGLMEIPFSDAPTREVMLIKDAPAQDDASAFYFQAAISHDGKTAAIASTYLAVMEKPISASDCALFFVDLSDPNWKVTKVPIPMTAKPNASRESPGLTNAQSPVSPLGASPRSDSLILREGDTLRITFPGSPNLNTTQQIRQDGKIYLPVIGEVKAVGMTPVELEKRLVERYGPQLVTKEVNVAVESSGALK